MGNLRTQSKYWEEGNEAGARRGEIEEIDIVDEISSGGGGVVTIFNILTKSPVGGKMFEN